MGLFGRSEPKKLNIATGPRGVPARNESPSVAPQTLIGATTIISGELNTSEVLQIEGRVEGKIKSSGMVPWCITLDNSKGISRLRFWAKNRRVNGINDLPVFMHQGTRRVLY